MLLAAHSGVGLRSLDGALLAVSQTCLLDEGSQLVFLVPLSANDLLGSGQNLLEHAHLSLVIQTEHGLVQLLAPVLLSIGLGGPLSRIVAAFSQLGLSPEVESGETLFATKQLQAVLLDADQSRLVLITRIVVHDFVKLRLQLHASSIHLHEELRNLLRLEYSKRLNGVGQGLSLERLHLLLAEVRVDV